MEYMIIEANYKDNLVERVNKKIKDGWIPLGGVAIAYSIPSSIAYTYTQAMAKWEKPK